MDGDISGAGDGDYHFPILPLRGRSDLEAKEVDLNSSDLARGKGRARDGEDVVPRATSRVQFGIAELLHEIPDLGDNGADCSEAGYHVSRVPVASWCRYGGSSMPRAQAADVPEVVPGRAAVGRSMLHVSHGGKLA